MIYSDIKSMVALNCDEYETKYKIISISSGRLSESCSNCINFKGEVCSKDLFNEIKRIITIN